MNRREQKEALRQQLLDRRRHLSEDDFRQKSAQIERTLCGMDMRQNAQTIHCYVSMNERREVATHMLIKKLIAAGQKVVVPITHAESGQLTHGMLNNFENLKKNTWGVLEPVNCKKVSPGQLDLVIVPMVGGDRQKNRIGYGKGFYDRFLQQVDCPTAGLLFEVCLVDKIPVESFDVPLSTLITEEQII